MASCPDCTASARGSSPGDGPDLATALPGPHSYLVGPACVVHQRIVKLLLTDGAGPLYYPAWDDELRVVVHAAAEPMNAPFFNDIADAPPARRRQLRRRRSCQVRIRIHRHGRTVEGDLDPGSGFATPVATRARPSLTRSLPAFVLRRSRHPPSRVEPGRSRWHWWWAIIRWIRVERVPPHDEMSAACGNGAAGRAPPPPAQIIAGGFAVVATLGTQCRRSPWRRSPGGGRT
jgi:hypothetical protein